MSTDPHQTFFSLFDDEVRVWLEQESIHIRALSASGDPAELTKDQAIELSRALVDLAHKIED